MVDFVLVSMLVVPLFLGLLQLGLFLYVKNTV
ncbi:MAG TPA: TadE/TadG family type IV pilus assembly protein, partial [Kribbella sp.]|nr:TadE/TadG family type IV pilus assembly protein [Kribbella sp.]